MNNAERAFQRGYKFHIWRILIDMRFIGAVAEAVSGLMINYLPLLNRNHKL